MNSLYDLQFAVLAELIDWGHHHPVLSSLAGMNSMTVGHEANGRCNVLIKNARIIDGTGGPSQIADVAIDGDRIAAVGELQDWAADDVVDATGLVAAPGFIDVHTHDDLELINDPGIESKVSQGVTSVIVGNCGVSLAPVSTDTELSNLFKLLGPQSEFRFPTVQSYRDYIGAHAPAVNVAMLVGHSSLRSKAMGSDLMRGATEDEIVEMRDQLGVALGQGAIGMSTGLDYPPARSAPTDEVVDIAKAMGPFENAVYVSHIRNERDQIVEAVRETIDIGRAVSRMAIVSHHKCAGLKNHGRSKETLPIILDALKTQDVGLDVYPYTASSTVLLAERIIDCEDVMIASSEPHPEMSGRSLFVVAKEWGCSDVEAVERLTPATAVYFQMSEDDVERIMAFKNTMIGSDGLTAMDHPHPRLWGTFPRVLARYVRERAILDLETAIHKMTGLSAKTFRLKERGELKPGNYADLVLFDPDTIEDVATFENPKQRSVGISKVMTNGSFIWTVEGHAGSRSGQFLTH
jgi:N-acyl-D-amino-acid deacylase